MSSISTLCPKCNDYHCRAMRRQDGTWRCSVCRTVFKQVSEEKITIVKIVPKLKEIYTEEQKVVQ